MNGQWSLGALCLLWAACGTSVDGPGNGGTISGSGSVISEHRPDWTRGASQVQLGGDCTQHGKGDCRSGLCLHVAADLHGGFVCSETCQSDASCPKQWRCTDVFPGSGSKVCVPNANTDAGVAEAAR